MPFEKEEKPRVKFLGITYGLEGTALLDAVKHIKSNAESGADSKKRIGFDVTEGELQGIMDVISLEKKKLAGKSLTNEENFFIKTMPARCAYIKEVIKRVAKEGAMPVALLEEKVAEKYFKEIDEIQKTMKEKSESIFEEYLARGGSDESAAEKLERVHNKLLREYEFRVLNLSQNILKNAWKKADVAMVDKLYVKNIKEIIEKLKPAESRNKGLEFEFL
jgi:hypothetical protein